MVPDKWELDDIALVVDRSFSLFFCLFVEPIFSLDDLLEKEFITKASMEVSSDSFSLHLESYCSSFLLKDMVRGLLGLPSSYEPSREELRDASGELLRVIAGGVVSLMGVDGSVLYSEPSVEFGRFPPSQSMLLFSGIDGGSFGLLLEEDTF